MKKLLHKIFAVLGLLTALLFGGYLIYLLRVL